MSTSKKRDLPNIVMVICHDLGQHLECYGAGINTPHLDKLADNPDYEDIVQDLRDQVQQWLEETEDPLLEGPVPPTPKQQHRLEEDDVPN